MRVLLDECVPRPLRHELPGHEVLTVQEMGWAGKQNRELLELIKDAGFDAFVTTDQNLEYQQDLKAAQIPFVVLIAHRNTFRALLPVMPELRSTLGHIRPGEIIHISA